MAGNAYVLRFIHAIVRVLPESHCFRLKAYLYGVVGGLAIDATARVYSSVLFRTFPIVIGARTHVGPYCLFTGANGHMIQIGSDCDIAPQVTFLTGTHEVGSAARRAGRGLGQPIHVGSGTWIGARSTILPGVTIGSGCVIAAGSVVIDAVPPNSLAAGVPAVVKKQLPCP